MVQFLVASACSNTGMELVCWTLSVWTGRPGVLQSTGSQRVRHDRVTEVNWFYQWQETFLLATWVDLSECCLENFWMVLKYDTVTKIKYSYFLPKRKTRRKPMEKSESSSPYVNSNSHALSHQQTFLRNEEAWMNPKGLVEKFNWPWHAADPDRTLANILSLKRKIQWVDLKIM